MRITTKRTGLALAGTAGLTLLLTACFPGDGMFLVHRGAQNSTYVQAGTYRTAGPTPDRYGPMCYWERLRGTSGTFSDIIANGISFRGPIVVTLAPTDRAFRSEGCQPWVRI